MIVAVSWMKDEADIVDFTIRNMIRQVDRVIVADHSSTDGTRDILAGHDITVIDDNNPSFHQSTAITRLARQAFDEGADIVVPFDADEIWCGLDAWVAEPGVWSAPVFDHVPTVADDYTQSDPTRRQTWRQREPHDRKVMFSWCPDLVVGFGNHRVVGQRSTPAEGVMIRHFPNRSVEQFAAKVQRGAASARHSQPGEDAYGAHWEEMLSDPAGIFRHVFERRSPELDPSLVHDPA